MISKTLCENLGQKAIKNMFLPIAHVKSKSDFRTYLDIKLKEWVERSLPSESINIGNSVIHQEFINLINTDSSKKKYDDLLDNLIKYVINEAWKNYIWEPKALNILVSLKKKKKTKKFSFKSNFCFFFTENNSTKRS